MRPHPLFAIAALLLAGACAGSPPPVPGADSRTADPVLVEGREVWDRSCSSCHAPDGSVADAEATIAAAKTALPGWRDTPPVERGALLGRLADVLRERAPTWSAQK